MPENQERRDQRRFLRVDCRLFTEFQLPDEGDWLLVEVLDLSIVGLRVRFRENQRKRAIKEEDITWRDVRFRFRNRAEEFLLDGHFLMVYAKSDGCFTAGVEFVNVTPEQQFKLVALYADYRRRGQNSDE